MSVQIFGSILFKDLTRKNEREKILRVIATDLKVDTQDILDRADKLTELQEDLKRKLCELLEGREFELLE